MRRFANTLMVGFLLSCTLGHVAACDEETSGQRCTEDDQCPEDQACLGGICRSVVLEDGSDLTLDGGDLGRDIVRPQDIPLDVDTMDVRDADTPDGPTDADTFDVDGDVSDVEMDTGNCGMCPSGASCCDDVCVDVMTSPLHCGACNANCFDVANVAAATCTTGGCQIDACAAGFEDCNQDVTDGCERNMGSDAEHCGMCNNACVLGQSCLAGVCGCAGGGMLGDTQNCGGCGLACPMGLDCVAGACACPMGMLNDNDNCGSCGNVCSMPRTCTEVMPNAWSCACPTGQTDCGGTCVDTATDSANCGMCGAPCPMGLVCSGGACVLDCPTTAADCDGDLTNGCEQTLNSEAACGTDCLTVRDCGGWGDECRTDANNVRHCRCDDGDHCRPGEFCAGILDNCECAGGQGCGATEFCCNLPGGRQCIDVENDALHCGRCGIACLAGQTCVMGVCQ